MLKKFIIILTLAVLFNFSFACDDGVEINRCIEQQGLLVADQMMLGTAQLIIDSEESTGLCTATAFEKEGKRYRFSTASHCVSEYNEETGENILKKAEFSLVIEFSNQFKTYKPEIWAIGSRSKRQDFAILEVVTEDNFPVIPLSTHAPRLRENISVVTNPTGLGNQIFDGYVSRPSIPVNLLVGEDNWLANTLLQISGDFGSGQGASGSSIVSHIDNQTIAILIGGVGNKFGSTSVVVVPISRFREFYKEAKIAREAMELKMNSAQSCEILPEEVVE
ncbi:MAG: trypsin-like peptidase domain-containing protein [bacterium]|nr:trypsin-like peptidase domain-containing protein [bacterium]